MSNEIVTSGMRPTGSLHLGNLLGALNNWIELQDKYECFFFIVDWHALTTPGGNGAVGYENVGQLSERVIQMATDWIAAGLDPEKSHIMIQSHVPEIAELHLLLSMVTPLGWLERNPAYKDMVENYKIESPSYGLLGYPTLQSADILAYKGTYVPVGKDQEAHINMTRDLAQRFNNLYGADVFPLTKSLLTRTAKVPGLDGVDNKMSKSAGNYIALSDSEDLTIKKVKSMFTDPDKIRKNDEGHPDGCVVFAFHDIYNQPRISVVREECEKGERGCVECKEALADIMNEKLRPIREERRKMESKPEMIWEILREGARYSRKVASETLEEVRGVMNLPGREVD
jgi:tryptophanyl-tRNA synthetase